MNKQQAVKSTVAREKEKVVQRANKAYEDGKGKAEHIYQQTKDKASELLEEGMHKIESAEEHLKMYSEHVIKAIKEKPLTSLLIAGGIGYLISSLLKK
ncbi:MAG: DUF883 domain-containing protein [Legionella sp.]|nr:DUF883 domain-containing protein [Legionella sp.]